MSNPEYKVSEALTARALKHRCSVRDEFDVDWQNLIEAPATAVGNDRDLLQIEAEVIRRGYGGRTGGTDGRLMHAIIDKGLRYHRRSFEMSVREMELATSLSSDTIDAGLSRLSDPAYPGRLLDVHFGTWDENCRPNRLTLRLPAGCEAPLEGPVRVDGALFRRVMGDDAFRKTRKAALPVFAALTFEEGATVTALAAATGMEQSTIRKALASLHHAGLAVCGAYGEWRSTMLPANLDDVLHRVAVQMSTYGKAARLRTLIDEERRVNRERIKARIEATKPIPILDQTGEIVGYERVLLEPSESTKKKPTSRNRRPGSVSR